MLSFTRQQSCEYFRELLKRKRKELSPAVRSRKKDIVRGATWLYPWAVERKYATYIKSIMQEFSRLAIPTIRDNLKRWLEETSIFDGDIMDAYQDEFNQLINDLRALQNETFVENEDEVKADIFGYGAAVNEVNRDQWSKITTLAIGTSFDL